jgi:acyl-CoA synthetase (NDP forming)
VITITGAGGVIAADLCGEVGLLIPKLGEKTIAKARDVFPDWASIGNPLDIYPAVERNGMIAYKEAVASVMEDENVDSLLVLVLGMPGASELFRDIFKYVEERCPDKTLAVCVMGEKEASEELYRTLETMNIPTYPSVERAVRALAALYKYRCFLSKQ